MTSINNVNSRPSVFCDWSCSKNFAPIYVLCGRIWSESSDPSGHKINTNQHYVCAIHDALQDFFLCLIDLSRHCCLRRCIMKFACWRIERSESQCLQMVPYIKGFSFDEHDWSRPQLVCKCYHFLGVEQTNFCIFCPFKNWNKATITRSTNWTCFQQDPTTWNKMVTEINNMLVCEILFHIVSRDTQNRDALQVLPWRLKLKDWSYVQWFVPNTTAIASRLRISKSSS